MRQTRQARSSNNITLLRIKIKKSYMMSALMLMMHAHGESFDFASSGMTMPHPMPRRM